MWKRQKIDMAVGRTRYRPDNAIL